MRLATVEGNRGSLWRHKGHKAHWMAGGGLRRSLVEEMIPEMRGERRCRVGGPGECSREKELHEQWCWIGEGTLDEKNLEAPLNGENVTDTFMKASMVVRVVCHGRPNPGLVMNKCFKCLLSSSPSYIIPGLHTTCETPFILKGLGYCW